MSFIFLVIYYLFKDVKKKEVLKEKSQKGLDKYKKM